MVDASATSCSSRASTRSRATTSRAVRKQCYTVTADLTADELAALGWHRRPAGLPVDLAGASLAVTVRVEKDLPHHLAGLTAVVTTGDANVLTLDAILSRWDEPVTITAPPADQVKGGG